MKQMGLINKLARIKIDEKVNFHLPAGVLIKKFNRESKLPSTTIAAIFKFRRSLALDHLKEHDI